MKEAHSLYYGKSNNMSGLTLPRSPDELSEHLKTLHAERKKGKKLLLRSPRQSLSREERRTVFRRTAGRCHICGGKVTENKFVADHVLAHAGGGGHAIDNYLAAHGRCNGSRWFYSPEEIQWILKMGVWARKQMEASTPIGVKMIEPFYLHEKTTRARRRVGGTEDLAGPQGAAITLRTISVPRSLQAKKTETQ